jgi:4'-phosphopantetheinyl transferase EntD
LFKMQGSQPVSQAPTPIRRKIRDMFTTSGSSLDATIAALAMPGMIIRHRLITPGDENALFPEEAHAFASSVLQVRRASGAARIVAREGLTRLGHAPCSVPRGSSGAPVWPAGFIGSLSHDPRAAVAAIALRRNYAAVGIDIEPCEPLPSDLLAIVATPKERARIGSASFAGKLLFAAKEAVYKAVHPLDHTFLDHSDVEIDFVHRKGMVNNGRVVDIRFSVGTHLVVLAFLAAASSRPMLQTNA